MNLPRGRQDSRGGNPWKGDRLEHSNEKQSDAAGSPLGNVWAGDFRCLKGFLVKRWRTLNIG